MINDPQRGARVSRARTRLFSALLGVGLLVVVASALGVAEWTLRSRERTRSTPPDYFPSIYYPHRRVQYGLVPNLDYFGWFQINALGFRGREVTRSKPAGVLRVLCLGGSTTFDTGVVGRPPWPQVLEEALRAASPGTSVEVLNLGIPGSTMLDTLIDFQTRGLSLEPDLVIVYQAHNDIRYSTRPPATTGLHPDEQPPRSWMGRWLLSNSLLYAKAYGPIEAALEGALVRAGLGRDPQIGFDDQKREAQMKAAEQTFAGHLRSLAAIAAANGVALVLPQVIFPRPENGGCSLCDAMPRDYGNLSYDRVASYFAQYNAATIEVAERFGAHYVPTTGWVPSTRSYYGDTVHFTAEGSGLMGTRLATAVSPIVARLRQHGG